MHSKLIIIFLIFLTSCFKQEPKEIEIEATEKIEKSRLDACTRMNLFSNLLEKENLVAAFDCTEWNKQFPLMRKEIGSFETKSWNNLLLPLSEYALNDRRSEERRVGKECRSRWSRYH